jgi:hypothetical protein
MNKLDHEEFCKAVFSRYLTGQKPDLVPRWEPYPKGENAPPDFNLYLDGDIYAVEITQFKQLKKYEGTDVQVRQAEASRVKIVNKLEEEAIAEDILRGTYCIYFAPDWLIKPTQELRKSIRNQVFEYLNNSIKTEQKERKTLLYKFKPFCEISKIHSQSNRIFFSSADAAWPNSPENVARVVEALNTAITTKISLLETPGVPQPWILLFGNSYPFASRELYQEKVKQLMGDNLKRFHSVFIVLTPNEGFMFYSQEGSWTNNID